MFKVLEELKKLNLNSLDDTWVQAIYYSEFLEFEEFPSDYGSHIESLDICYVFRNIMNSIDRWLHEESCTKEEKSWAALSSKVPHQKLLAVLAYYIDYGTKNVLTKEYRNNALVASRFYYKLLSIPGYKAYHIYHSQLFAHSLACLNFPKALCENEDNNLNSKELTHHVNSLIRELQHFVVDLRAIMESLQLTHSDMNFEDILSHLVDITGGAIVYKLNIDKIELSNISRVIYEIIDVMLHDTNNKPNASAIKLLFKCFLPKLVSASVDCRNANNLVRASYVTYSGLLLSKYGKAALSGFAVLLQHLCYTLEGLERAEVRAARVSLVVGLMSLLPRKSYRDTVRWLLNLSTTSKMSHRHIALEILATLLSNGPEEKEEKRSKANPSEPQPDTTAMQIDDPGKINEKAGQEAGKSQWETKDSQSQCGSTKNTFTTDDESSQELPVPPNCEELSEEEIAGLLSQRQHTVPHAEILRAVYERVHDVSSTIRARALAVLGECLASAHKPLRAALQELDGSEEGGERPSVGRLMAVAARCVCDERAAVRRAAGALVQRHLAAAPCAARADTTDRTDHNDHTDHTDLSILVGLCRDASVLVRGAAISAVGELAARRPHAQAPLDALLAGPMHQLADPETKIQEQVLSLVRGVLVERVRRHAAPDADPLPWLFLAAVVRHNMRRHLQRACALLAASTTCINHRLVEAASTHLGAAGDARDLQCLLLLTSVARHVPCEDAGFVLRYYYQLASDQERRDVRLMPLTLELVGVWAPWAGAEERAALRDHLVRSLAAGGNGCRTASAALAAHLDPDNLQWATELMQISERRALEGAPVEEWVRAADLSLVAPVPPGAALLRLFLDALAEGAAGGGGGAGGGGAELGAVVAGAGRLCVRARDCAAAAAPLLAALLDAPRAPLPARLNALHALTDICTRYTCIVEPLLESVCGCLARDAPPPLRRATARALTKLLLGGYLRLRTPLYYRYCALLADEEHDVREPAEYYVTCCLTADSIYHHFVDCLLHYNRDNTECLSFDSRQLIYDVMLQRMSAVQRLNAQCRLARELLAHAADVADDAPAPPALPALPALPAPLHDALLDAITLLCGPRMRLPKKPQNNGDAADIDDLQERVTTNIVSHKMKRTVAEVLVPAVLRLYARLRAGGGQLAAYLVRLATDLLADYRAEIEELIDNDEELVGRVRQFQETIGLEPSFGNARNLVTASAPPEPDTPRAPRRRAPRTPARGAHSPRKRALRI